MSRKVKHLRRPARRRRLSAESLEDRRLLATLSFLPSDGTPLTAGKLFIPAGGTVNISAEAASDTTVNINNYLLNFNNTSAELSLSNFSAAGSEFTSVLDSDIEDDRRVSAGIVGQVVVPPPELLGTFDVTVPSSATDGTEFTLTANFLSGGFPTNLIDPGDNEIAITDFGDLIIQVGDGTTSGGVDLELVPPTTVGTVSEETIGGVLTTVITVDAGTVFPVMAQIESAPEDVNNYQLNFGASDAALALDATAAAFVAGSKFSLPVPGETGLDSTTTPPDRLFSASLPAGGSPTTPVPPVELLGTFMVTAPSAAGDYRLTSETVSGGLTSTFVTNADGDQQVPIDDFGDLIVRVSSLPTVSVTVNPSSVLEDGAQNLTYTFTRTGGTQTLTVDYTLGPGAEPATEGVDFASLGTKTVTIGASGTATVVVDPTPDTDVEQDETVTLVITPNPSAFSIGTGSATGTIEDDDVPTVSVSVSPSSVAEDGTENLTYTFTLAGSSATSLTVNYTTGGTATPGTDYTGTSNSVTIPASGTATVVVDPTPDTLVEGNETVVLTITPNSGVYNIGTGSATGTIIDGVAPPPTVSVSVSPSSVAEDGAQNLTYTFTRTGGSATPLTVNYTTGGTATAGTDYTGTSNSVTIPASGTATVVVDPTPDTLEEGDETVILTITPNAAYNIGTGSATGTILDGLVQPPTVSVSVSPSSVVEDGAQNLTYTFTRTGGTATPLTVNYTTGGTATPGVDYTGTSTSITIPASGTATVIVDPTADTIDEPDETVVLTITPNAAVYNIGTGSASATILDDDPPAPGGNRIITPRFVARPYLIPGDGRPTAVLFRANANTTVHVLQIGVASANPRVSMLDQSFQPLGGPDGSGNFSASLLAGNLYAVIFEGRSTDALYTIRSSAGFEALSGSPTNILRASDVNADGESTALDALMVINQINRQSLAEGEQAGEPEQKARFYDVNGDGKVTASDALGVINDVARQAQADSALATPQGIGAESEDSSDDATTNQAEIDSVAAKDIHDACLPVIDLLAQPIDILDLNATASEEQTDDLLADESFLEELTLV